MKITVIGAGYVGLVTAVCLSELGNEVLCIEKLEERINKLKNGISPIYEPGLEDLLKKNLKLERIKFSSMIEEGVNFSNTIFLCVGTPQSDTGKADLSQVEEASRDIAQLMDGYKLIIEKSTVPVNTHLWVKRTIKRYCNKNIEFDVASNPEFLREGSAIEDFMNPDRIIIGVESNQARKIFEELYNPFIEKGYPVIFTTIAAAELIKHASNSFLAMKISYINMISELCEVIGADIKMVAEGMGFDKRIGKYFLNAGIGYGGSCFPKDVKAFIKMAENHGIDFSLLRETENINKKARQRFIKKIEEVLWINKNKIVAVWGLSFKPNTDDIREAPSIEIVSYLIETEAIIRLYDPQAMDNFKKIFPPNEKLIYSKDCYEAVRKADALLILTEWKEFIDCDIIKIRELMRLPIIIDGRNIFDPQVIKSMNIEYYCIGRN